MNAWLSAAGAGANLPAVLVTVAIVEGSGPRQPGARMLVTAARQFDTIGGGHMEQRAVEIARAMLALGGDAHRDGAGAGAMDMDNLARAFPAAVPGAVKLERFALGPSLGQCCGGVVHLVFEVLDSALRAVLSALRERQSEDCWRLTAIDGPPCVLLFDAVGRTLAGGADNANQANDSSDGATAPSAAVVSSLLAAPVTALVRDAAGRRWLADLCLAPRAHLTLFGAGHVGAAIVRCLADLPCRVAWVDEREDMFPATVPGNVTIEASDTPEALVSAAPSGGSFLVMTHNHALDQRLTEAIMARADAGWFGLIGSLTKRHKFEHRLRERGVDPARIAAMVCPIGLPGIGDKAPAVIAASVCAQLLMVWEAESAAAAPCDSAPLRLVASNPSAYPR
jgi:xanthine dehydrogenase accessory factor